MAGEPVVELVGNVGAEPEVRFARSGDAVASFPVAVTPRVKQGDEWVDGDTLWFQVAAWRRQGEAVAEHVRKGQRVRVVGRLAQDGYTAKDGTQRTALKVTADPDGVTLVPRAPATTPRPQEDDPWTTPF